MKKWIAMLLALVMCFTLAACGGSTTGTPESTPPTAESNQPAGESSAPVQSDAGSTEDTEAPAESETPAQPEPEPEPEEPGIELSDDLADFTVSIDGTVYQFPCSVQSMLDDNWNSGLGEQLYTREVGAGDDIQFAIYRGDLENSRPVFVHAYNPGKSARTINECVIIQITEQNDKTEVILAGNFKLSDSLTLEDITGQYGEGSSEESQGETWYKYSFDTGRYIFVIEDGHLSWWDIIIRKSAVE